jgi:hypothetical protein
MSRLHRFTAQTLGTPGTLEQRVVVHVDDVPLLDLVRDTERPFAEQEGASALAGNYVWPLLTPRLVRLLLGEPAGAKPAEGVLLNCECGWASCWPLSVRVRSGDRFVIWHDVRQLRRLSRWNYEALEPLRFHRASYLDEIAKVREALLQLSRAIEARRFAERGRVHREPSACAM